MATCAAVPKRFGKAPGARRQGSSAILACKVFRPNVAAVSVVVATRAWLSNYAFQTVISVGWAPCCCASMAKANFAIPG
jgi:hypothetical protein